MTKQTPNSFLLIGAIAGGIAFVAFVALLSLGGFNVSPAAFLAIVIGAAVAIFLFLGFHKSPERVAPDLSPRTDGPIRDVTREPGTAGVTPGSAGGAAVVAATHADAGSDDAGHGAADPEPAAEASSDGAVASETTADEAEIAARDAATVQSDADADVGTADSGEIKSAVAAEPVAETVMAPQPFLSDAPAETHVAQENADDSAEVAEEERGVEPERLTAAREGGPDDLKLIKGVGPKLEQLLHRLGFYHFDQVASWSDSEVAWVDHNLEGFKGRVSRDDWVAQAKILAAGGETEFSRRQ
ncbi:endonuclease [Palleronia caenipelagi]|uniref:endonuclease n=1 Tax=Palleronia caenipelagi TaxID=2489174 RepID=UPI00319E9530